MVILQSSIITFDCCSVVNIRDDDDYRINKYRVTMVCWSTDDQYIITAVNDFSLKVWNSFTGQLYRVLQVCILFEHPWHCKYISNWSKNLREVSWGAFTYGKVGPLETSKILARSSLSLWRPRCDRLEIQILDSMSDSLKPSDRFDNFN